MYRGCDKQLKLLRETFEKMREVSVDNDLLDYADKNPIDKTPEYNYDQREQLTDSVEVGIKKSRISSDTVKADLINSKSNRVFGQAFINLHRIKEFDGKQTTPKTYAQISNIKISPDYQGKGIGFSFYEWLVNDFEGIDALISDTSLTKKGKRGSYFIWEKLSKKYNVEITTDGGSGVFQWKPTKNIKNWIGKGKGAIRFGIRRKNA